ncbi:MAG TPA: host attachment protein [Kofleriaceae bacterium]|nr:host attachment protein [Kofleriaceae bacterium]
MTQRTCIVVADASRARLFLHEREVSIDDTRDELIECADLVNPARRLTPNELFSDTRTGSSREGGRHFGFDDHRDAHVDNLDDEFARLVSQEIEQLASDRAARRVVVCASPHMLGLVRRHLPNRPGTMFDELAKDLVKLSPSELRAQLATYGVLPPRPERPGLPLT